MKNKYFSRKIKFLDSGEFLASSHNAVFWFLFIFVYDLKPFPSIYYREFIFACKLISVDFKSSLPSLLIHPLKSFQSIKFFMSLVVTTNTLAHLFTILDKTTMKTILQTLHQ
jgi:hypothetical protein